ncbi:MAG: hypothetical protein DMG32_14160 [Acidobacteria bacterium]|nr:MAG: hypothetical protein DMG32_14160 [Acidobacteriota bacterium]
MTSKNTITGSRSPGNSEIKTEQSRNLLAGARSDCLWTGQQAAVYIDLPFWNCSFGAPKAVSSKNKFTGLASIP